MLADAIFLILFAAVVLSIAWLWCLGFEVVRKEGVRLGHKLEDEWP